MPLTVQQLIEELKKLPPSAINLPVLVHARNGSDLDRVHWEGNSVVLEGA